MNPGQLGPTAPKDMWEDKHTCAYTTHSTHLASPVVDTRDAQLRDADGLGQVGGVLGAPHLTLFPASLGREAEGGLVYHFCSGQW